MPSNSEPRLLEQTIEHSPREGAVRTAALQREIDENWLSIECHCSVLTRSGTWRFAEVCDCYLNSRRCNFRRPGCFVQDKIRAHEFCGAHLNVCRV